MTSDVSRKKKITTVSFLRTNGMEKTLSYLFAAIQLVQHNEYFLCGKLNLNKIFRF